MERIECQHAVKGPMLRVCTVCGHVAHTNGPVNRRCDGPPKKRDGPGFLQRVGNFAGAMASAAADGFATITPEQLAERREICSGCEMYDAANNKCNKCGCPLSWKPTLRSAVCELGKWPAITPK